MNYTAEFYSHETTGFETVTQEFEGSPEFIADNYFTIYGDTLGRLTDESGTVVYDNMDQAEAAMNEWAF